MIVIVNRVYLMRGYDMIIKEIIDVRYTPDGVYLSAKTENGNYGQHYNTFDKTTPNFAIDLDAAKQRFMDFYNRFE